MPSNFGTTNAILPGGEADVNPFAAKALPNNGGAPAPAPTDTAAPPASTSTSAPASNPAVVSTQPAEQQLTQAQQTVDSSSAAAAAAANAKAANANQPGYDASGNPIQTPATSAAPTPPPQSAEDQLLSQAPDGMKYIYDANGQQHEILKNDPTPSGYTDTKPGTEPTTPVVATAEANQYQYKQYSDGTYGVYAMNGQQQFVYQGTATQTEFQNAQAFQSANNSIMGLKTPALSADQQAQVDALQAQWNVALQTQQTMNKNNMGGLAMLENLRGLSGDTVSMAATSQQITANANALADVQAKADAAIQAMKDAFNKQNIAQVQQAFTDYNASQDKINTYLKDMQTTLAASQKAQNAQIDQAAIDVQIGNQIAKGVTDPNKILAALTAAGMTVTAKQVADTMANLSPNATAMKDLIQTVAANGGGNVPGLYQKITQAAAQGGLDAAYEAAGLYGDGGTGIMAEYHAAVAAGYSGGLQQFMTDSSAAKASGTAAGKTQGTPQIGQNLINIPQNMGTQINQAAYKNKNPGNLKGTGFQGQVGTSPDGFAIFDTNEDGYAALVTDITTTAAAHPGNTLYDLIAGGTDATTGATFKGYSPLSDGNDPKAYAAFLEKTLGVKSSTTLSEIDPNKLAAAIGQKESGTNVLTAGVPDPSVTDANAPQPSLFGQSLNSIQGAARTWIATGGTFPLGLSSSGTTGDIKGAIVLMAGTLSKGNPTMERAFYSAEKASQQNLTIKLNATEASQQAANDNMNLALQASAALPRNGSTLANRYQQWAQGNLTTNTGLTQLEVYIYTAAREYAKVTSGSAGAASPSTDTANAAAENLISAAQSPANFQAAINAMQNDMQNMVDTQKSEQTSITDAITQSTDPTTQAAIQTDQQAQQSVIDYGKTNAVAQSQIKAMVRDGVPWTQIEAALGINQ